MPKNSFISSFCSPSYHNDSTKLCNFSLTGAKSQMPPYAQMAIKTLAPAHKQSLMHLTKSHLEFLPHLELQVM